MDKKSITKLLSLLVIIFSAVVLTAAQDDDTARSLTSNDFEKPAMVKNR